MLLTGPMDHLRYMSVSQLILLGTKIPDPQALCIKLSSWGKSKGSKAFMVKIHKQIYFAPSVSPSTSSPYITEQNEIIKANEENLKQTLQKIKDPGEGERQRQQ